MSICFRRKVLPFVLIVSLGACAVAAAEQAELTYMAGTVEVLLPEADDYASAEEGMFLEQGDTIKTAPGASAELSFNEENTNIIRMSEGTLVKIVLSGAEKVEMTEGEVFASVAELPAGSAFEIRTPTAVSGARNTDWVTRISGEETEVEAIEDQPYVKHYESGGALSGEVTMVAPGHMTRVARFARPVNPHPMTGDRIARWGQVKGHMKERAVKAKFRRQNSPRFDRKKFKARVMNQGHRRPHDQKKTGKGRDINKNPGQGEKNGIKDGRKKERTGHLHGDSKRGTQHGNPRALRKTPSAAGGNGPGPRL